MNFDYSEKRRDPILPLTILLRFVVHGITVPVRQFVIRSGLSRSTLPSGDKLLRKMATVPLIRQLVIILAVLLTGSTLWADTGAWNKSLRVSLGISSALTRIYMNHKLLEKRNASLDLHLDGSLNNNTDSGSWKNSLTIDYAGTKDNDETDPNNDKPWTESSDQFIADSVYRRKIGSIVEPYAGLNVQTKVFDGGDTGEWRAFKPLQTRESIGMSAPIISTYADDLSIRAGYFFQSHINQDHEVRPRTHGVETVIEFKGNLAKNITLESKAGMYSSLVKTPDYDDPGVQSRKMLFEWDNRFVVSLAKFVSIDIILNVDNKDVSSKKISYEIDHRTDLALDWKLF